MIHGDITKIDLGTAFFERIINNNNFYVDKSALIEHFLLDPNQVILITRHRRSGKSLNMDMLRCFLTNKKDCRHLFEGLYIKNSLTWAMVHSGTVFSFSFKNMNANNYKYKLYKQVYAEFYRNFSSKQLSEPDRNSWAEYCTHKGEDSDGLLILSELAYNITGKNPYFLVDEYDRVLRDYYQMAEYDEIFDYIKSFLSAGLKDNPFLEKAMLTGVLRISYESMFSDLNNITTYDMFDDKVYTDDYGLTDSEMDEIHGLAPFDPVKMKQWYNGIRVNQKAIYNIYSVSSFLQSKTFKSYWGNSRLLDMVVSLMNDNRLNTVTELLNGTLVEVPMENRVSLKQLWGKQDDASFYSFLVQGGYLSLDEMIPEKNTAKISIPNIELSEVWKKFILSFYYTNQSKVLTMFDHADNLSLLARDIETYINDSLSYYDLSVHKGEDAGKVWERVYHIFILGILSAYTYTRYEKPISEGESGDGRYDILYKRDSSYYIFEFKSCMDIKQLDMQAQAALDQIDAKRYGASVKPSQPLVMVGIAIYGKQCSVKCAYRVL